MKGYAKLYRIEQFKVLTFYKHRHGVLRVLAELVKVTGSGGWEVAAIKRIGEEVKGREDLPMLPQ